MPKLANIDKPLIIGAIMFGIGWGLYGYCPGPAISSLAYGDPSTVVFVIAMAIGMYCATLTTSGVKTRVTK